MKYKIVVDSDIRDLPKEHEFSAAIVIAEHFRTNVVFMRSANYKTPDFDIDGAKWELKSPMGNSSRTIENNRSTARRKSANLIIDLSRAKIHQRRAVARINFYLSQPNQFKRVLVITKAKKVIEIR